ncbi:hypothetical protein [Mucilaginibacter sp.]|uniref:hypothetical protein n=1 Tax=Mucilaginibacter sp. TaxID=1882438 RepID=UPI00262C29B5|nr:hypothetical protein [Mucilaginibacter sp.]MDB4918260.1 hypothetical protein [Mucilaginibacter sp.]
MKKLIAITLLGLQIFSICGHLVLYQYFVYQSDKLFNDRISKNLYNVHDLVQIKVPAHTGVTQNWNSFEKINGQIQFKSTCYNYVKLKLTRDTIYLMCVPNYEKTRLFNQNIINASQIADIPVNKKDHVPFGKAIDLGKYNYPIVLFKFSPPVIILQANNIIFCSSPVQHYIDTPHQPPKMFC